MRILLLTIDFPPARGGVQRLLSALSDGLVQHHDLLVVTPRRPGDREWDRARGYRVSRAWAPGLKLLDVATLGLWAFVEVIWQRPDLIICGHVLLGPFCRLVWWCLRIPFVAMAYALEVRAPRMRGVAGWALRGAAYVVTISEFSRQAVLAYGVPPEQVVVIRPGAAVNAGYDEVLAESAARRELGGRVFLSVSRLTDRYKGHDMVIRALPLVRAKVPDAQYVIVGNGWLRTYLERLAASLGVCDAVTFTGEVSDEELDAWYRRCEVFVMASRESTVDGGAEGYGIVFIEANLRGKAVIGGRSGGIPDAVRDGVTGLLVNPLNVGDIADAVVHLLGDPLLAARLGAEGRRRALEDLSWAKYVSRFEEIVTSVAGPSRIPAGA